MKEAPPKQRFVGQRIDRLTNVFYRIREVDLAIRLNELENPDPNRVPVWRPSRLFEIDESVVLDAQTLKGLKTTAFNLYSDCLRNGATREATHLLGNHRERLGCQHLIYERAKKK